MTVVNLVDFSELQGDNQGQQVNDIINQNLANLDAEVARKIESFGEWSIDAPYPKNALVTEQGYTGISLEDGNDEHVMPQGMGDDFYTYDGTLGQATTTVSQLVLGQRFIASSGALLKGYSFYAFTGNEYTAYTVSAYGEKTQLFTVIADSTGWVDQPVDTTLINGGDKIDLILIVKSSSATTTDTVINYNYSTPNNNDAPIDGQVVHSGKEPDKINFSKKETDGTDQSSYLESLTAGDVIKLGSEIWTIQSSVDSTTYMTFLVIPSTRASSGNYDITFESSAGAPITYPVDIGYYVDDPNIKGLFSETGYSEDIPLDNNCYGFRLLVQDAFISTKWHRIAAPQTGGSSGGGSGGGGIVSINGKSGENIILNPDDLDDAETMHKFTKIPATIGDVDVDQFGQIFADITQDNYTLKAASNTQELSIILPEIEGESDYSITVYNANDSHYNVIIKDIDLQVVQKIYPKNGYTIFFDRRYEVNDWVVMQVQGSSLPEYDVALFGDFNSPTYAQLTSNALFLLKGNGNAFFNHPFTLTSNIPYVFLVEVVYKAGAIFKQRLFVSSQFDSSDNMDKEAYRAHVDAGSVVTKPWWKVSVEQLAVTNN